MSLAGQHKTIPGLAPNAGPRAGWRAQLDLSFEHRGGTTELVQRQHRGPLVVQRPFYPEGDVCHVYVIHPPGGVVAGDELALGVRVGPGARVLLTTPAAGKFYRSEGPIARLAQDFEVSAGMLEWLPQENIFYPGAAVEVSATMRLSSAARFLGWEVSCFGLTSRAEPFHTGELRQHLEVWLDGALLLRESQQIDWECIAARWGMAGNAALGTFLAYPAIPRDLDAARGAVDADTTVGCSLVDGVLICRAIAQRGDRLRQAFAAVWSSVRPLIMDRAAVPPRIWAT